MNNSKEQSNPISTGGGGGNFENKVQALFLISMLSKSYMPFLPNIEIKKIKLQGKYDGYDTDDFIVFGKNLLTHKEQKILGQVKNSISISASNDVFKDVIQAAWNDFNNQSLFNKDEDTIVLVTGPLSNTDIKNTRVILEWARCSENEVEFIDKVNMPKFSSNEKQAKLNSFKAQLKQANNNQDIDDKELWEFLRSFHIIGYDLDVENSRDLSLVKSFLSVCGIETPSTVWNRALDYIRTYNQNAGTITLDKIPDYLMEPFQKTFTRYWTSDLRKLEDHSQYIISSIKNNIGGYNVSRKKDMDTLIEMCNKHQFIYITGERGSGKSSLLKAFIKNLEKNIPIYCFRIEDFNQSHLNQVFTSIGLKSSIQDISLCLSLIPKKYLIIESVEKLLELENGQAFVDLLQFIKSTGDWTVICTGRTYAYQEICFNYLQPYQMDFNSLIIQDFDNEQLKEITTNLKILEPLIKNKNLKDLMRNPFMLDLGHRLMFSNTEINLDTTEEEFQNCVWKYVISNENERANGMPLKRKEAFINIALQRAKEMSFGVPIEKYNPEVIFKLENDSLIIRDRKNELVSPLHDVFEDWALTYFIERKYNEHDEAKNFIEAIGETPAIGRAFRIWLQQKLRFGTDMSNFIKNSLVKSDIPQRWKDEILTALLLSNHADIILNKISTELMNNECNLLKKVCFILRVACMTPREDSEKSEGISNILFLKPYGPGWMDLFNFIYENRTQILDDILTELIQTLKAWGYILHIDEERTDARVVGLICLEILEKIKGNYRYKKEISEIISVMLRIPYSIENELTNLISEIVNNPNKNIYEDEFLQKALVDIETRSMCKYLPDEVIKLAYHAIFIKEEDKHSRYQRYYGSIKVDECFGIEDYGIPYKFSPPSGLKGPFADILKWHSIKGLDFILNLVNTSVEKYVYTNLESQNNYNDFIYFKDEVSVPIIKIEISDNLKIQQYLSHRLWNAYRGKVGIPSVIKSALMALENWIISYVKYGEETDIRWIYEYVLKNSNSVATTSILAAVATGYPEKCGKFAVPILKVFEFYSLDFSRYHNEFLIINHHNNYFDRNPLKEIFYLERKQSNEFTWRQKNLEDLLITLQFSELQEEIFLIIDRFKKRENLNVDERFFINKVDTRDRKVKFDEENNQVIIPSSGKPDLEKNHINNEDKSLLKFRIDRLMIWTNDKLKKEQTSEDIFKDSTELIKEIKDLIEEIPSSKESITSLYVSIIIKACSICITEFYSDLNQEELELLVRIVYEYAMRNIDNSHTINDKVDMLGEVSAFLSLVKIYWKIEDEEVKEVIRKIIIIGLTHPNKLIRVEVAKLLKELQVKDEEFYKKCLICMIDYSFLNKKYYTSSDEIYIAALHDLRESALLAKGDITEKLDSIVIDSYDIDEILNMIYAIDGNLKSFISINFLVKSFDLLITIENKNYGFRHREKLRLDIDTKYDYLKRLAEIISINTQEKNIGILKDLFIESCKKAPELMNSLFTNLEYVCEENNILEIYWSIWRLVSATVQDIACSIDGDDIYNDKIRDYKKLIRGMLHADTPWQKLDYENMNILKGKKDILSFVEQAGGNLDVYESLSSLIYHFPDEFFEEGILILSSILKTKGSILSSNTVFYLEMAFQKYLVKNSNMLISKDVFKNYLFLLDKLVLKGSCRSYYVREYLIKSKKIRQAYN
ncbi:hypothetical protein [Lysinibacillus sp. G01H]|uniref:hypothetical protein n=1 Tax=Lysinibacillus sp. G01H TaxID=3026425 RepID=UPI00237D41F0|nr:hypothetical protein [Lysinibacillus sp. G01H]WDU77708.1 hypothetical protein PSR12_13520 [Lysinibacillus sp. G01H]